MKRKIIVLVAILSVCFVGLMGVRLLPTNDYMKQTFSEKISAGHKPNIVINGDSIGGWVHNGEWCTLLEEKIESSTNQSSDVTNISKPGNSSFAGIV